MKVSREQMAENRRRILDVASGLFREKGFDAVGVAEVMKGAGLTHGGFYNHFASKDDLFAQALGHAIEGQRGSIGDLDAFLDEYLSPRHRDNAAHGCPFAGMAADVARQTPEARGALTEGMRAQIDRLALRLPGADDADPRSQAMAMVAAMVGAAILSRAVADPEFSDEILRRTRSWLAAGMSHAEPPSAA